MRRPPSATLELPRAFRFKVAPELNSSKRRQLEALQAEWSATLPRAFDWFWQPFLRGGLFPYKPARSGPKSTFPATGLVTSQKDLMAVAIEGQARSWASNLARRITLSLMRCPVLAKDPALRRQLLWLNSMRAWLMPYPKQLELLRAQPAKSDALIELTASASRCMRKLVRRYLELHRLPDPRGLPLQVNQLSAVLAPAKTQSSWAAQWLRISTLERGKKVELPVMANPYAQARGGRRATTFSLLPEGDDWYLLGTQYVAPQSWPEHRCEVLAIDLGLRTLMATSEGDLRGVGFLDELKRRDAQLLKIQKGLQGAGHLRLGRCKRYRVFVTKLRGYLKTTLQTHSRALLELRRPQRVVVEELLFAGQPGELSRRMNRLLRRFGQRYFTQTLEELQAELGFELVKVDAAYTSQACAACGFVHRDNRRGDEFECLACGHRAHADVNAAKNQRRRSTLQASSVPVPRTTRWARALGQWAAAMQQRLAEASPGSSRQYRIAGSARAGLQALAQRKSSASRLSSESRQALLAAVAAPTLAGLLDGLRVESFDLQGL